MSAIFEMKKVVYAVGANSKKCVVSGTVSEGGFLSIRGPSGSGKTTLLRILARLKEPGQGQVYLHGTLWTEYSPVSWRRKVHYLAQKPVVFEGTVRENLFRPFELAAVKRDLDPISAVPEELMERLFLPKQILDQDARTISGGEASRIALVRALLVQPSILLMDEPLAALDAKSAGAVLDLITKWAASEKGRGAVMVSHTGDLAKLPGLAVVDLAEEGDGCSGL